MENIKPIRTVLVPLDGSETGERALPWARALANPDTEIVLMEVTPMASTVRSFGGQIIGTAESIQDGYRQIAEQQLTAARERWFDSTASVRTVIAIGDPGEQILDTAEKVGADLIVMSSHGRGAVGRFVSGSVADRVMRHAPIPVMIVGPEGELASDTRIERIVAPIQDSDLSLAALPVAASVAKNTGVPVQILNVIPPPTDSAFLFPGAVGTIPPATIDNSMEHMTAEANTLLQDAIHDLKSSGVDAKGTLYTGSPAESIVDALQPGDVIVLSSHARQGLARWAIGSTSMKLIRNGQAPVIVVTRESIERANG